MSIRPVGLVLFNFGKLQAFLNQEIDKRRYNFWIGLKKKPGTSEWQYVDGTQPQANVTT